MGIGRSTYYYKIKDNLNKKRKEVVIKDRIATIPCKHHYYVYKKMTVKFNYPVFVFNQGLQVVDARMIL
jgi:hypothetical protein